MENLVFIAAEKSSLPNIKQIIDNLPHTFNFPIFICIPYIKSYKSDFIKYLSTDNNHIIKYPDNCEKPEKSKIYIAPPLAQTFMHNDAFFISREHLAYYPQPSIDLSLISFAENYKQNLIAIFFPKNSKEGIFGLKKLKSFNGKIFICKDTDNQENCNYKDLSNTLGIEHLYSLEQIITQIAISNQYAEY